MRWGMMGYAPLLPGAPARSIRLPPAPLLLFLLKEFLLLSLPYTQLINFRFEVDLKRKNPIIFEGPFRKTQTDSFLISVWVFY
jgi:hypothetical protein